MTVANDNNADDPFNFEAEAEAYDEWREACEFLAQIQASYPEMDNNRFWRGLIADLHDKAERWQ